MIDFSSALYLEMNHSRLEIPDWQQLTTGVPASVFEAPLNDIVSRWVARMQGLEQGLTAPSTLHLYTDLYEVLSHRPVAIFMDEYVYPVSGYGIEKMMVKGIPVHPYRHLDARHLGELIESHCAKNIIPVILTDGWCPQCGKPAPLKELAALLETFGGYVVMDDTQAFGLLGQGGGGMLRWSEAPVANMISITSLAKSFGVPMAVISGPREFITGLKQHSRIRDHSSPASMADLCAAIHAFDLNFSDGDRRRNRLFANVLFFQQRLAGAGVRVKGGLFPVQHLAGLPRDAALQLHRSLLRDKIRTVLTKGHHSDAPQLSMLFRAGHSQQEIGSLTTRIIRFHHKKYLSYGNYS
jgi:8-amino-7-oxononanoate synthase